MYLYLYLSRPENIHIYLHVQIKTGSGPGLTQGNPITMSFENTEKKQHHKAAGKFVIIQLLIFHLT